MILKTTNKTIFTVFLCLCTIGGAVAQNNDAVPAVSQEEEANDAVMDSLMNVYNLPEMEISAAKPLVKVELDKIIYNTAEDADAQTSTVLDMLKKVPLVTVDANNKISLKGSSNFVVYLNGKPSGMFAQNPEEALRTMPANVVKNIEVITDPGAKYDAEGVAGIINITTISRTAMNGVTSTVNAGVNSQGGGDAGVYLMAKKGKVGFSGNLNAYKYRYPDSDINKYQKNLLDNSSILESAKYNPEGYALYGAGELSIEIDTLNLINIGYNTRYGRQNSLWTGTITQTQGYEPFESNTRFRTENGKYSWGGTDINADYQRTSKKNAERRLTLSYRYSHSPNNSDSRNQFITPSLIGDIYSDKTRQYTDARTNEHTFQADYSTPIGKIHAIETGVKYILRQNKSNSDYLVLNDTDSWLPIYPSGDEHNDVTLFNHRNDIMAAYGSYALKLDKWGLRAGFRYEYTLLDVEFERNHARDFDTKYDNLVPSLVGSYQIDDMQNVRLGYNMRLNRPGIWQLNPYINDANPNFIEIGNPNLNAVQTHTINFNYGYFNPKFNLNANLSHDFANNTIEQITEIDGTGTSITTFKNIGEKQDTKLTLYFNWTPTEKFKLYSNLGGSYVDIRANDGSLPNRGFFSGWMFAGAEYKLPWSVWLSGLVVGGSSTRTLQTTESRPFLYQFNVRKDFLQERLNVRIYATAPFTKEYKITNSVDNPTFFQEQNLTLRPREFGINVSFRFGELNAALKKTAKSIANDDVIESEKQEGGSGE